MIITKMALIRPVVCKLPVLRHLALDDPGVIKCKVAENRHGSSVTVWLAEDCEVPFRHISAKDCELFLHTHQYKAATSTAKVYFAFALQ